FVPIVVAVAGLTFATWMLVGPEPRFAHALVNAVAVLIIACPCALGLATPMSIMVGAGRGATAGVLIRNAEALEAMEKVDTLLVDKTGTITEGKPRIVNVQSFAPFGDSAAARRRHPGRAGHGRQPYDRGDRGAEAGDRGASRRGPAVAEERPRAAAEARRPHRRDGRRRHQRRAGACSRGRRHRHGQRNRRG